MSPIVRLEEVGKSFGSQKNRFELFKNIDLTIEANQLVGLRGRSGSGKTTLLNLIGILDRPTSGEVYIEEQALSSVNEKKRSRLRREKLGFIFQSYGLVSFMTVEENISFGLRIAKVPRGHWQDKIKEALELVGLYKRRKHYPYELSGGEQQRIAIARGIVTNPLLVLADEPTAELDSVTGLHIMNIFQQLVEERKTTIIMTSHDPVILDMIEHVYALEDKKLDYQKNEIVV